MFSIAKWIGSRRASHAQATERNSDSPLGLYNTASTTEKDKTIASGIELTEETALEAQKKLKVLQRKHEWDPNLPSDTLEDLELGQRIRGQFAVSRSAGCCSQCW